MMKHLFLTMILALIGMLPMGPESFARAQSAKPVLHLASVDNIPPYVFRKDGNLTGISMEIINELAKRGGFAVKVEVFPWARVLLQVEKGMVDGAFSAYKTAERQQYALYTGIIHNDELCLAVKKGHEFPVTGIESLYGKVIGKGRSVHVSEAFDRAAHLGKILLYETDDMRMVNIKKLHEGRLDAVIGSPAAMQHYAHELGYEDIVILPHALKERIPAYLILSKRSNLHDVRAWQQKLTRLLDEMRADSTIPAIYRRYGVTGE